MRKVMKRVIFVIFFPSYEGAFRWRLRLTLDENEGSSTPDFGFLVPPEIFRCWRWFCRAFVGAVFNLFIRPSPIVFCRPISPFKTGH